MHQSVGRTQVRRNAEIELVCSESYYDGILRYAADQSGPVSACRAARALLNMQNVCSEKYVETRAHSHRS